MPQLRRAAIRQLPRIDGVLMKEWDDQIFRCDVCEHYYFWNEYDKEAGYCNGCSAVTEEEEDG
jgi:hypothetical protein